MNKKIIISALAVMLISIGFVSPSAEASTLSKIGRKAIATAKFAIKLPLVAATGAALAVVTETFGLMLEFDIIDSDRW